MRGVRGQPFCMDSKLFWQLLATFVVAVSGWWIVHWLSGKRDVANERRKLRVSYLVEAYRKLEAASNTVDPQSKWEQLESAIADVQLLGTPRQVGLARFFAEAMARDGNASLDELLFDLRESLRVELQLEPVSDPIKYLRFKDDP
jgi:hypothetical protein